MKLSDYFNYILKNKLAFSVYPILISLVLTLSYYFFKDKIKYLETSSQIYSEYEVIDILNEDINDFYISAHELILDAERMLFLTSGEELDLQYVTEIELIRNFINYQNISDKFFEKTEDLIRRSNFASKYSVHDLSLAKGKIHFSLRHPYNLETDGDIDIYSTKINQELEDDFINILNMHKKFVQINVIRYFEKIKYYLRDKPQVLNKYIDYLNNTGADFLFKDTESFKLKDDFYTLNILKGYEEKRLFPMPSIMLILIISYILGVIITFIFTRFRNKSENLFN